MKTQNYINHIAIVLDGSGSMSHLRSQVIDVFNSQIKNLAQRSKEMNQETRVSVYVFNNTASCLIYDMDALRLPSIAADYNCHGGTALIDATLKAIEDLEKTATLYGDHSFLLIALTDGQENTSHNHPATLSNKIANMPDNWTLGAFVPDAFGVAEAKRFGFSSQNVQQWNTDGAGLKEVGETISRVTTAYMTARASGVRGTKSLFAMDTSNLTKAQVVNKLDELRPSEYTFLPVRKDAVIKDFVEGWKLDFRQGANYYQLTKPETVQSNKQIAIRSNRNGKVYTGSNARGMLGLPNHEVRVAPGSYGDWTLFVQSNSVNRKLVGGTELLVLK